MKSKIEKIIRETLVVQNDQSIWRAAEKIEDMYIKELDKILYITPEEAIRQFKEKFNL